VTGERNRGRWTCVVLAAALAAATAACRSDPDDGAGRDPDRVTVASFDFAESQVLAALYGGALEDRGFAVDLALGLGPRELVDPALAQGLVDVVPEYAGTATRFLAAATDGEPASPVRSGSADAAATHRALVAAADGIGATALAPAPARDANAIVVTRDTATRHRLRDVSDLAGVDGRLVFGGPPECATRPLCLRGLEDVYGLRFAQFVPLDVGGPLTLQGLVTGDIDVGVLFTSDPALRDPDLVELRDDRRLQPVESVTPLVRDAVVERFGASFTAALDRVSRELTTAELRELNAAVARRPDAVTRIARDWLERKVPA
jgi:osmoprotectant transport system substrate-binding protein